MKSHEVFNIINKRVTLNCNVYCKNTKATDIECGLSAQKSNLPIIGTKSRVIACRQQSGVFRLLMMAGNSLSAYGILLQADLRHHLQTQCPFLPLAKLQNAKYIWSCQFSYCRFSIFASSLKASNVLRQNCITEYALPLSP